MNAPADNAAPRASLTDDYQRDWPAYFDAVKDQAARATCVLALNAFEREGPRARVAVDLACGEGRDARAMLARGFSVIALDQSAEGLSRLARSLTERDRERVTMVQSSMEDAPTRWDAICDQRVDYVNASFALPFCDPSAFPAVWKWIVRVLRPGGRFAGQLFGDRDEWQRIRPGSHYTRQQAIDMLVDFELEHFEEVEKFGGDAMGGVKHHHLFHIVGRRKG